MEFRLHDKVKVRNYGADFDGKTGVIIGITADSPPPYHVAIDGMDLCPWMREENLLLRCECEPIQLGCFCGAAKREQGCGDT